MTAVLAAPVVARATDVRPAVGHRAPDFTLPDLESRPVQLSQVLRDKAVLLNFWATWCPPCRREMPTMERAYRDYRQRGLEILAISMDAGDQRTVTEMVGRFMREFTLSFPALLDLDGEVVRAYRLRGLPTTVLIDRTGTIRAVEIGLRDWSSPESRKQLEALLP